MERLDKWGVMPVRGEAPENIIKFEDLFPGIAFGDVGRIRQFLGSPSRLAENPGVVCVEIITGDNTETDIGFDVEQSQTARILGGKRVMILSTIPWANVGDPRNIVEANISAGESCVTFLSSDGKDPRTNTFVSGYVRNPSGGYSMVKRPVPPRPDGGLRPYGRYYVTLRRTDRTDGDLPPLNIRYLGSDDPAHGGEVYIPPSATPQPPASTAPGDGSMLDGIPMQFGDMTGVFFITI